MEANIDNYDFGLKDANVKIPKKNAIKSYKCNQCDYASSHTGHLRTHLKTHSGEKLNKCNQCDLHLLVQMGWWHIWKHTVVKSQTNATCVTMHPLMQVIWGDIWKHTVTKSQTHATSVIMHALIQVLWEDIWKHTVEKNQTNAISVTMHPLAQVLWGDIWRGTGQCRREKIEYMSSWSDPIRTRIKA